MAPTWSEVHDLEVAERYPEAIGALEQRLQCNPTETEAVVRLGFNLWYAVVEDARMQKRLPIREYAQRFMELFHRYRDSLRENADFCWAFGQGIQMFWFEFPGASEAMGRELVDRACRLDPFWADFWTRGAAGDHAQRLRGRGIFQSYYNIA